MKTIVMAGSALVGAMLMQMPSTPPMKMGLWESSSTMTMKMPGMENMPAGMPGMGPRTTVVKSCMTPESYAKNLAYSQQQKDCTRSNEVWSSKGYSFDLTCSKGKTTGHFEMTFDSKEAAHGSMHMSIDSGRGGATMDSVITTKFLGADCGAVTPDKPVIGHTRTGGCGSPASVPQGLKPCLHWSIYGTAEAVPLRGCYSPRTTAGFPDGVAVVKLKLRCAVWRRGLLLEPGQA